MSVPTVRTVRVRLSGEDEDAREVAEILVQLLEEASDGRCQAGEISRPYPNRRESGARVYLDLYLLLDKDAAASPSRRSSERSVARRPRGELGR